MKERGRETLSLSLQRGNANRCSISGTNPDYLFLPLNLQHMYVDHRRDEMKALRDHCCRARRH